MMKRVSFLLLLAMSLSVAAPGCGGGSGGGKSLTQQVQDAARISDASLRAKKLAGLAEKQHATGDILGTASTLGAAREAALSVSDPSSKASTLIVVAASNAKTEQSTDDVKSLLKEAGKAIEGVSDPFAQVPLLADLAAATGTHVKNTALAASHLQTAEEAAAKIENVSIRAASLAKIAIAYGQLEGRSEDANRVADAGLEFAHSQADPRDKCDCLGEIAIALAKLQRSDDAAAAFEEAQAAAGEIATDESKAHALLGLGRKARLAKNQSLAATLFDRALDVAESVPDASVRGPLIDEIQADRNKA
ncbi:MAG TPA: hypothetical protein VFV87_20725 [Pirellulaceae bacterium]|nr:hypothetical protein [Pirellulaceae bacterium]